jgi:hypothetical protein
LLVAAAVVGTCLFPALAGSQTSAGVPVTGGSWYWQEQVGTVEPPVPGAPPLAPPGAIPTPDVPAGELPVSVVGGQPDKETFLQLDTSAIPQGSTVSSLVLTLHEDASNGFSQDMATVEARPVTGFMSAGAAGAPWANRPDFDTSVAGIAGKRDNGTWTFDITPIAQGWASGNGNNGVALVPAAPGQGQTYEVVWVGVGKDNAPSVSGSFTPPAPGTPQAAAASESGGGEATTAAAPIAITPDLSSSAAPTESTPSAGAVSTPATGASSAQTNTPVRRIAQSSHRGLPWSFFFAVVLAIALIGASTLSLGELGEPQPDRQGGVLRALERRAEEVT